MSKMNEIDTIAQLETESAFDPNVDSIIISVDMAKNLINAYESEREMTRRVYKAWHAEHHGLDWEGLNTPGHHWNRATEFAMFKQNVELHLSGRAYSPFVECLSTIVEKGQ